MLGMQGLGRFIHSSSRRRRRHFHGLIVGAKSPERPVDLKQVEMKNLYFTNDFVNNRAEYRSMIPFCVPNSSLQQDGSRRKSSSWVEVTLPLSQNSLLRESMISFIGNKIRYGKLFEVIDAIAADTCYKHIGMGADIDSKSDNIVIVTACVDGMLAKSSIKAEEDLTIQSFLTHVGRSSMEVHVNLLQMDEILASTQFIFVPQKDLYQRILPPCFHKLDRRKPSFFHVQKKVRPVLVYFKMQRT